MSDLPVRYDWTMAGQYMADCEEQPGQWVTYSDHCVSVRAEEAILKDRERMAYILFFLHQKGNLHQPQLNTLYTQLQYLINE